jgi:hypothetical protein
VCLALALAGSGCVRTNRDVAVPTAPDDRGLVAHWTFDEGSGAVARDVTGNGHDATLKNTEWVPSPRGQALRFDSKDDQAQYGNIESMMLAGDLTLAAWVKTDASMAPSTHRLIFGDSGYAVQRNGNLAVDSYNRLSFEWGDGKSSAAVLAPGALMNGAWKHVVAVANSAAVQVALYVDGAVVAEMPMPLPICKTAAKERTTGWFYNGFFQGDLDDIRLYSRALSPAEVQGLFRSQADVTVGAGSVVYESTDRAQATVTVRNFSREPRRVEVSGPNRAPQVVDLPPGASADVPAGKVPLKPVWRRRNDILVCESAAATGKLTVTSYRGDVATTVQQISLTPPALLEPLQVVVHDPWQAKMASGKTAQVKMDVTLALPTEQLRAGTLQVRLLSRETGQEALRREVRGPAAAMPLELDVRKLPWGAYDLEVSVVDAAGRAVVSATRLATILPGGKQQIRVLNNLASELMDARARGLLSIRTIEFMNPRQGWVWFKAAGGCAVRLPSPPTPLPGGEGSGLLTARAGQPAAEAMRLLPAGRHVLEVSGAPTELVVRAIPALVYNVYPSGPQIAPFGSNTWERLKPHTLANTNMIESQVVDTPEQREWLAQGKLWIGNVQAPGLIDKTEWTVEKMLEVWLHPGKPTAHAERPAFTLDKLSGVQVDEYYGGALSARNLDLTTASVAQLAENPAFAGKLWIPFLAGKFGASGGELLLRVVLGAGWPFSEEVYLGEMPTEAENLNRISGSFRSLATAYEQVCPGAVRRMIFTPMYAYLPYCTTNCYPQADFRVHLDMQLQVLAGDPAFFGLWGVQPYRSNYVDEEILNCMAMLLRHYAIEGRTDRFMTDPYALKHVVDPDYTEGLAHWQVTAAETGSVSAATFTGYGELQGRYPVGTMGDTFAVLTRSTKAPNVLRQELRGLTPGRLYSLKVFTGDYADLQAGRGRKDQQVFSLTVDGAEVQPGGFSYPFKSCRGPKPFTAKDPFWMTYHWLRFRATGPTATLSLSDWADPDASGAPAGQQTMVNFVEVQPVLETAEFRP